MSKNQKNKKRIIHQVSKLHNDESSKKRNFNKVIIEARKISRKYKNDFIEVEALKDVSLSIREGEILAIIGPSGCGKTTLLNSLAGLDEINGGVIFFEGKNLFELSDNEKTRLRANKMGFIFQNFNLIPVLTAKENVELPLILNKFKPSEASEIASTTLKLVGLSERLDNKPAELSGGERQRVAIARAIAHKPSIIWADEPTGNLDTRNSEEILNLIIKINNELKTTFVIVTHDLKIASNADRVIRMDSGKIIQ